jgi:DNA invertase Pin-like site-specific DNA recombinase
MDLGSLRANGPGEHLSDGLPILAVAEYVRGSTEDQEYSPVNQSDFNHGWASQHRMEIVLTYYERGKSGLTFDHRPALKQLVEDVVTGNVAFRAILVYDVSRWGRFQNPDESTYYEYVCRRAGIAIHYCAEPFADDTSPYGALFKYLKRTSAAEFSRELSVKVFAAHSRLFQLGFRQGGMPPYGTRRLLIDQARMQKFVLRFGQRKGVHTDRVITVPGPPDELRTVRWIYAAFVDRRKSETEIARILNKKGVDTGLGRPWTPSRVHNILRNEIYIGNSTWNRTSFRLRAKFTYNRPEAWLRAKCNFPAIVDPRTFEAVQAIICDRNRRLSDEEMIEPVRRLYRKRGLLSADLIDRSAGVPSTSALRKRFGGLRAVYILVGFAASHLETRGISDGELLARLRQLLDRTGSLSGKIIDNTTGMPSAHTYAERFGTLCRAYKLIGFEASPESRRGRAERTLRLSNEELLDGLRRLLKKQRRLNASIIEECKDIPCVPVYKRRFGGLPRAYELIGYRQKRAPR